MLMDFAPLRAEKSIFMLQFSSMTYKGSRGDQRRGPVNCGYSIIDDTACSLRSAYYTLLVHDSHTSPCFGSTVHEPRPSPERGERPQEFLFPVGNLFVNGFVSCARRSSDIRPSRLLVGPHHVSNLLSRCSCLNVARR